MNREDAKNAKSEKSEDVRLFYALSESSRFNRSDATKFDIKPFFSKS